MSNPSAKNRRIPKAAVTEARFRAWRITEVFTVQYSVFSPSIVTEHRISNNITQGCLSLAHEMFIFRVMPIDEQEQRGFQRLKPGQPPRLLVDLAIDTRKRLLAARRQELGNERQIQRRVSEVNIAPINHSTRPRLSIDQQVCGI